MTTSTGKPVLALWNRLHPDVIPAHESPRPAPSVLHVALLVGDTSPRPLAVQVAQRLVLGRGSAADGDGPDVDLTHFGAERLGVSHRHAALIAQDGHLLVEDLNSLNGTRLNGLPLRRGACVRLRNNDELELGGLRVQVRLLPRLR